MSSKVIIKLTIVKAVVGNKPFTLAMHLPYHNGKPQVSAQMIRDYLGYTTEIPVSFHA